MEKEAERAKVILKKYEENPAQQKKVLVGLIGSGGGDECVYH